MMNPAASTLSGSSASIEALNPALTDLIDLEVPCEQVAGTGHPNSDIGFLFTEGPLWDPGDGSLLFSDIPANRIYRWKQGQGASVFRQPSGKSNGLAWDLDGSLLACEHANRRVSRTLSDGSVVPVVSHYLGRKLNSPNDLVVRSDGTLYFTDPPYGLTAEFGELDAQDQPINGLYLLRSGESEPALLADDLDRPNGLAFSPDERRLYVADTSRYQVRVFDVAADGTLLNSRVAAQFREDQGVGRPDGMKVDVEGNLYTTGPGGVWVMAADFTILGRIRTPEKAANVGWGDADRRSLFITASTSVYRLRTQVPGLSPAVNTP